MFCQACRNIDFSPPIVLGIGSLYAASSMMLHRFSMGLRSGEFAGHSSFWIKFGRFLLRHCCVAFPVWAGAPSWTKVALLLFVKSFRFTGSSVVDLRLKRGFTSFSRIFVIQYSAVTVCPCGMKCREVRPRPVMPPQTIHLALPSTWYDGGTWLSCEPHTMSFLGFGRWKRYLGHSSLKRKFSYSSAVNLRYLRANTKRAFLWLLLRSGSFFRLKGFHPFLDIYLHTAGANPGRPLFFSCLLIFLVVDHFSACRKTLVNHFATHLLLFYSILAVSRTDTPDDRRIAAWALK